jgi:hypothetical protein
MCRALSVSSSGYYEWLHRPLSQPSQDDEALAVQILARNLLGTLRNRELVQAARDIAAKTGLEHRPVTDGQRVAGIYRRSVMLASGRYAILDDGKEIRGQVSY